MKTDDHIISKFKRKTIPVKMLPNFMIKARLKVVHVLKLAIHMQ